MRNRRIMAAILVVACLPVVLWAGNSSGIGSFFKQVPGTDRQIPITGATFADKVFFRYVISAEDGEHSLQVNVYDGSGREVYNSESTLVVKGGRAGGALSYGFNRSRDSPGKWWYVAALDDTVVVSSALDVSR